MCNAATNNALAHAKAAAASLHASMVDSAHIRGWHSCNTGRGHRFMAARLNRFRVTQFRSIEDSGWIDTDEVTALIGTNESGKTNLLMALWKLNPAKGGSIDLIKDLPRKRYHSLRNADPMPTFICAEFQLDDRTVERICAIAKCKPEEVLTVRVSRRFAGGVTIEFPNQQTVESASVDSIREILDALSNEIESAVELRGERGLKHDVAVATQAIREQRLPAQRIERRELAAIRRRLKALLPRRPLKTSSLVAALRESIASISGVIKNLEQAPPSGYSHVRQIAWKSIPPFVYYSQYGNLDSEIYLPHVIENLERDDLGIRDEARTRTLKVLFEFVKLSPQEILKLGQEDAPPGRPPTDEELEESATRSKEREILLQSASTDLTERFREWWKQGDYLFRFQADGNHFRIWVSDDRRPEQIELEGRSSGLQWFFSFYLVFLVEAEDAHEDAILLLDEPGLSLHPISQRDLSDFFRGLATKNQLLYTTHSPFMVDPDRLDRVKAVFTTNSGATAVSEDLRASAKQGRGDRDNSIYPVHAALGLSASDALLQGCQVVIVEGSSDQLYLSAIKMLLIGSGHLKPSRELVFVPAGGVKGVKAIAAILSGKENMLPKVLLDSDAKGREFADHLASGLYADAEDRVLQVSDFFDEISDPEIEDLWPTDLWAYEVTRFLRGPDPEFDEQVDPDQPVCDQVERYAAKHNLTLEKPGWKTAVAQRIKQRVLDGPCNLDFEESEKGRAWKKLFDCIVKGGCSIS